ncbi:MAG: GNAT family N-acetyltransferase [Chloroflexi bacterium]|nr:GNAT family N-acetyltransferase [Chloroflexota bacterium]
MTIQIRRAQQADVMQLMPLWKELAEFHANLVPEFALAPGREKSVSEHLVELIDKETHRIFVADDDGTLIGFASGMVREMPQQFSVYRIGYIEDVVVTARSRRCGVGKRLTNALIDWFRESGIHIVHMSAAKGNPVSQTFWHKMGFNDFMVRMRKEID